MKPITTNQWREKCELAWRKGERLADALREIATYTLEDEPDAAVLISTARTALAKWENYNETDEHTK